MSTNISLPDLNDLKENWGWMLAMGIAMILGGTAAIAVPLFAELGVVTVLGILLLVAGIVQIVGAFHCAGWRGVLLHMLIGILYLVTGFLMLENPVKGVAGLTLLLAAFFLASGLFRVVVALKERFQGWGWTLLSGAVTVVLGLIIWRQFPESALWVIGLLIGIDLIFNGWMWIMLAFTIRKMPTEHDGSVSPT